MGRHRLTHAEGCRTAVYGFDSASLGFFVEVWKRGQRLVALDRLEQPESPPTLGSVVSALVEQGFFTGDEVFEALTLLALGEGRDLEASEGVRTAALVIENLRSDAAR